MGCGKGRRWSGCGRGGGGLCRGSISSMDGGSELEPEMTNSAEGWTHSRRMLTLQGLPGPAPCRVNNSAGRPRQEAGRPGCRLDSRLVQRRATRARVGGVHLLRGFGVIPMSLQTVMLVLELGKLRPKGLPCRYGGSSCSSGPQAPGADAPPEAAWPGHDWVGG